MSSIEVHPEIRDAILKAQMPDVRPSETPEGQSAIRQEARTVLACTTLMRELASRYAQPVYGTGMGMTYGEHAAMAEGRRMVLQDITRLAHEPQEVHHAGRGR